MATSQRQRIPGGDERGVALPMAMILLLLLSSLTIAFAVMSRSEPVIANNQLRVAQARALADSGLERAIWGLDNPGLSGLAEPLPNPVPAPYNGTFVGLSTIGGYEVTVTAGATDNQRNVDSRGWTPTSDNADTRTKAHRRITATVLKLRNLGLDAPCALCVRGDLGVGGNSLVDGTQDTSCGNKFGSVTSGKTTTSGAADIKGAVGGDPNVANEEGHDYKQNEPEESFDKFTLSPSDLQVLRNLAKANGTYYGPGSPSSMGWTADGTPNVHFSASNKLKDGIVFIDNATATDITKANEATVAQASVRISGNPFVSPSFSGILIINGFLDISGGMKIDGLVYALNDISYNGTGAGRVEGLMVSQNVRDTAATNVSSTDDSATTGNSKVIFNCQKARGLGQAPDGWLMVPGTYREIAG